MARIRTIKPEFFNSADVADLTPLSRLFYAYLWTEADREGWVTWNVRNFRMRFFPTDDYDVEKVTREVIEAGLVTLWETEDGAIVGLIPSFLRHQVINNRECSSEISSRVKDACTRVKAEGRKEGKERKEMTRESSRSSGPVDPAVLARWEDFWKTYPRKEGKKNAKSAFLKLKEEEQGKAISDVKGGRFSATEKKFVPHAATYLNQERWTDEVSESTPLRFYGNEL